LLCDFSELNRKRAGMEWIYPTVKRASAFPRRARGAATRKPERQIEKGVETKPRRKSGVRRHKQPHVNFLNG
jgi:hypothetical protein